MADIPSDGSLESTLALFRHGYLFLTRRREQLRTDVFSTRLLLRKVICIGGPGAAELFYDSRKFRRAGVVPSRVTSTLLGKGGIHSLDEKPHHHRKAMFMGLMAPASLAAFRKRLIEVWETRAGEWGRQTGRTHLFPEVQSILCETICGWAGVPVAKQDLPELASDLTAMVDAFGGIGPRNWRGRFARHRRERWARDIIAAVRCGKLHPPDGSGLHAIAWHRTLDGMLLTEDIAAVELLNVVRPTMAVAYLIVFAALALEWDPAHRERLGAQPGYTELFAQEVRRFFPFTPFLGAATCDGFEWRGYRFPAETTVLLDVYGIDHDPRIWRAPDRFDPDRFRSWDESPFTFIPQGGGSFDNGHRCPGEWLTIDALKISVAFIGQRLQYGMPEQDLSFSLARMPTYPASGFAIENVRLRRGAETGQASTRCPPRGPTSPQRNAGPGLPLWSKANTFGRWRMGEATKPLAVVTGASTGIGYELAKCCAENGFDLIVVADEPEINRAAEEFRALGATVQSVHADLATLEGVDRLYERIGGRPVAALCANAGRGLGKGFLDQDFDDVMRVVNTNITGTIYLIQKVGRDMRARGEGRILITGSIAGFVPGTYQAVYNATKSFLDSFSFALRAEIQDSGVTVTCLMPGATETDFFERADMLDTKVGAGKKDDPADVARIGFDAMMKGKGDVVTGWQNKLQSAIANVVPASVLAEQHRKKAEPGSARSH